MKPDDIEKSLHSWELFKEYGQFNLYFEAIVAEFRELLIELVKLSYGFNIDLEEPDTLDVVPFHFHDRLLKIIVDDGAAGIIEKCRACYTDSNNPAVQKILAENEIEPLQITEFDRSFAELVFKKAMELVKLRNIIIHSHYSGFIYNIFPETKLTGSKDVKTAKGYEQRTYEYDVHFLNQINLGLEEFASYVKSLNFNISLSDGKDKFNKADYDAVKMIDFNPPAIQK